MIPCQDLSPRPSKADIFLPQVTNASGEEFRPEFEVVLADPPYLSDECLTKTAITIRKLATDKIILCTGKQTNRLKNFCF